jgi:hypothetical protein
LKQSQDLQNAVWATTLCQFKEGQTQRTTAMAKAMEQHYFVMNHIKEGQVQQTTFMAKAMEQQSNVLSSMLTMMTKSQENI